MQLMNVAGPHVEDAMKKNNEEADRRKKYKALLKDCVSSGSISLNITDVNTSQKDKDFAISAY